MSFQAQLQQAQKLRQQGNTFKAESLYRKLAGQFPEAAQIRFELALLLAQQQNFSEAESLLMRLIQENIPVKYKLSVLNALIEVLRKKKNWQEAFHWAEKRLDYHRSAQYLLQMGIFAAELKNWHKAEQAFAEVLSSSPALDVYLLLLRALRWQKKTLEYESYLAQAFQAYSDEPLLYQEQAEFLLAQPKRWQELECLLRRVHTHSQEVSEWWLESQLQLWIKRQAFQQALDSMTQNQGVALKRKKYFQAHCLYALGQAQKALELLELYLKENEADDGAQFLKACILLSLGEFNAGFACYEIRRRILGLHQDAPDWQGQKLATGETLLLYTEQGFGDAIQFARFIPQILPLCQAGELVLICPENLKPLFQSMPEVTQVLTLDQTLKRKPDWQLPLMSLPYILQTELNTLPADIPYFHFQAASKLRGQFRVGLVWAAGKQSENHRCIPIEKIQELIFTFPQIQFYAFQLDAKERGGESLRDLENYLPLDSEIKDFGDTAKLLKDLNLLISVDTAVVHLAGALGVPCWVLLSAAVDWRWMHVRRDSPWYPSVELFRSVPGAHDWGEIMSQVTDKLRDCIDF